MNLPQYGAAIQAGSDDPLYLAGYVLPVSLQQHFNRVCLAVLIDTHPAAETASPRQIRLTLAKTVGKTGMQLVAQPRPHGCVPARPLPRCAWQFVG